MKLWPEHMCSSTFVFHLYNEKKLLTDTEKIAYKVGLEVMEWRLTLEVSAYFGESVPEEEVPTPLKSKQKKGKEEDERDLAQRLAQSARSTCRCRGSHRSHGGRDRARPDTGLGGRCWAALHRLSLTLFGSPSFTVQ